MRDGLKDTLLGPAQLYVTLRPRGALQGRRGKRKSRKLHNLFELIINCVGAELSLTRVQRGLFSHCARDAHDGSDR